MKSDAPSTIDLSAENARQAKARAERVAAMELKEMESRKASRDYALKAFWYPLSPPIAKMLNEIPDISLRDIDCRYIPGGIRQAWEKCGVGPRHFSRFENQHAQWQAVFDRLRDRLGTGLLVAILGPRGTGKTQLAACLCRAEIERKPPSGNDWSDLYQSPVQYRTLMDVFLAVRATFKDGTTDSEQSILKALEAPRLLILDEVQERTGSDFENRLLTHLIDARYMAKRDTILIGNMTSRALATSLGPSIISRMEECGGTVKMDWESFRRQSA